MTREAKIGLLTGLGVIVLIGVLLSEYLGGPGGATSASTNRMASLPIAQSYRDQQLKPIGVPGMAARAESTEVAVAPAVDPVAAPAAPSIQVIPAAPLMNQIGALPRAMASDAPATSPEVDATPLPNAPVVAPAITPINDGPVLAHVAGANNLPSGVPMFQLQDAQTVSLSSSSAATNSPNAAKAAATPVAGQEYVIASGDTLTKIAKKFYNSSKPDDCQRIVAANSSYLKSTSTVLMVGKKLTIPNVPGTVAAALRPGDDGVAQVKSATGIVIRTPGSKADSTHGQSSEARKLSSKSDKESTSHYVVQSGDTPEKIARKFGGSLDYARQLMAMNKIKDASKLQIGMKLKLPAK